MQLLDLATSLKDYIWSTAIIQYGSTVQRYNQVTTADPDDPLTQRVIQVRPRLIKSRHINPATIQAMGVAECSSKAAKCISIHAYATL